MRASQVHSAQVHIECTAGEWRLGVLVFGGSSGCYGRVGCGWVADVHALASALALNVKSKLVILKRNLSLGSSRETTVISKRSLAGPATATHCA